VNDSAAVDGLSEAERHPLLSEDGRTLLKALREHPQAPRFNALCGDRLDRNGLAAVAAFDQFVQEQPPRWRPGTLPAWLPGWLARMLPRVPAWRELPTGVALQQLPSFDRADLADDITRHVPVDLPLDRLVVHQTFGSTGHRLTLPWTPEACAMYLPLLRRALALVDVGLPALPGRVAVLLACWQRQTVVVASVASYLGEAGFLKLNLHPDGWRDPADRSAYLRWANPYLITGDPLSFHELLQLAPPIRPAALVSSSMSLSPALAEALRNQFGCPVIDLYACNESGPIAARDACSGGPWTLLQPGLYAEVLGTDDRPLVAGEWGELTLTGGFDPYLPLLRYRTGDQAQLAWRGDTPMLQALEGRAPVLFEDASGRLVNNIDVSVALKPLPLRRFSLRQGADRGLQLALDQLELAQAASRLLEGVFGAVPIRVSRLEGDAKVIQYGRDQNTA
jgi:phenylacetate-CoA ligase